MRLTVQQKSYIIINLIFAGVILFIIGYSFFYSPDKNNYPVMCIHERLSGEQCPSCGLSHALSLIVRGRIDDALEYNYNSLRVFLFFAVQLLMRAGLTLRLFASRRYIKNIIAADVLVTATHTIYAFFPYLRATWLTLFLLLVNK